MILSECDLKEVFPLLATIALLQLLQKNAPLSVPQSFATRVFPQYRKVAHKTFCSMAI